MSEGLTSVPQVILGPNSRMLIWSIGLGRSSLACSSRQSSPHTLPSTTGGEKEEDEDEENYFKDDEDDDRGGSAAAAEVSEVRALRDAPASVSPSPGSPRVVGASPPSNGLPPFPGRLVDYDDDDDDALPLGGERHACDCLCDAG